MRPVRAAPRPSEGVRTPSGLPLLHLPRWVHIALKGRVEIQPRRPNAPTLNECLFSNHVLPRLAHSGKLKCCNFKSIIMLPHSRGNIRVTNRLFPFSLLSCAVFSMAPLYHRKLGHAEGHELLGRNSSQRASIDPGLDGGGWREGGKREGGQPSGQLDSQAQPPAFLSASEMTKRCFENSGPTRSALSHMRTLVANPSSP